MWFQASHTTSLSPSCIDREELSLCLCSRSFLVGWKDTRGLFFMPGLQSKSLNFKGVRHPPDLVSHPPACLSPTGDQLPITLSVVVDFCQIPCLNGGRCIGRDECWCPANSTGKFCHLPVPQPDREPPGRGSRHRALLEGPLKQSTFTLPLSNQLGECQPL